MCKVRTENAISVLFGYTANGPFDERGLTCKGMLTHSQIGYGIYATGTTKLFREFMVTLET